MKAIVQDGYGSPDDVLQLQDIDKPAIGDDDVLVRVRAASVHPDVWHVVTGRPYVLRLMGAGLRKPKQRVPGTDAAGQVEAVGRNVSRFRPGDAVFGETVIGHQWAHGGAFAEYVSVRQDALALKPERISFEQAAAVCTSGLIALNNLRFDGRSQAGRRVLINGAGGGVGSIALQIAKAHGAHVTGVDSAAKLAMLRALGADEVFDHREVDVTRLDERYDLILDVASNLSFPDCRRVLTNAGVYVLIGHDHYGQAGGPVWGSLPRFFKLMAMAPFVSQLPKANFTPPSRKVATESLRDLLETGKLTPVIDRSYPLGEIREALRHLRTGDARGKIVVTP